MTDVEANDLIWYVPVGRDDLVPQKHSPEALAYDFVAPENVILEPHTVTLVKTGVSVVFPTGMGLILGTRSSYALKKHVTVEAGWIDNDYRGEIGILLYNHGSSCVEIQAGDRIAQGRLTRTIHAKKPKVRYGRAPNTTERGLGGFGSTGE